MSRKIPAVLGLQRALVITDARMRNIMKDGRLKDVLVFEHGIVGTQNVNNKAGLTKAASNLQRLESAKLDVDAVGMSVSFDVRGSDLNNLVSVCSESSKETNKTNAIDMKNALRNFIEKSKEAGAVDLICQRYARNILNGRWLWRNKNYAVSVNIKVTKRDLATDLEECIADVSAFDIPTKHFNDITDAEKAVADVIARNLKDEECSILHVDAIIDFGVRSSVEVYPSQNYCDKGTSKNGIGRSLFKLPLADTALTDSMGSGFKVVGRAAIRDQKISNAIRTIDDWYKDYDSLNIIIPVEPLGASLEVNNLLRTTNGDNGFKIFEKIDDVEMLSKEALFLLALLVRGGVYGSSGE